MRPIFCGNFEYDSRESELERLFRKYGKVERVDMKSGFAFIYMEDERDAEDAIRALDRIEFGRKGRTLRVEWTKNERGGSSRRSSGSRRSSSNMRPSKTLFVINFDPHSTRARDLERHFEPYGKITNVRIRRNFAFVQYDSQEDATRALEAANMSKLMDRVISVEYAVKDDDVRGDRYSPDRRRDRSPDRRRRSPPSPYRRERGSPDYGRDSSPRSYRKERGSPDYGRGGSPSPYRRERASPRRRNGESPYRRDGAGSLEIGERYRSRSKRANGHDRNRSPYGSERPSPSNGRGDSQSPRGRERSSTENGQGPSPSSVPERRDSHGYDGSDSPMGERDNSQSPPAEE